MVASKVRRTSGRLLLSAVALALPLALGGCLKGGPLPPPLQQLTPPEWDHLTVNFSSNLTLPAGPWVTTVTVPGCTESGGGYVAPDSIIVTVSNGTIVRNGVGTYTWTRAPGVGGPLTAAAGNFTADCVDYQGLHAHPVLAVTAPALA